MSNQFQHFLTKLDSITNPALAESDYKPALGITIAVEQEKLNRLLSKGRWDMFFLSSKKTTGLAYGMRIIPNLPYTKWPIYITYKYERPFLYCDSIQSLLGTLLFDRFDLSARVIESCKSDMDWRNEIAAPFLELFEGQKAWKDAQDFLFDNIPSDFSESAQLSRIMAFEAIQDPSEARQLFRSTLQAMIEDEDLIPIIDKEKLGIYQLWLINAIAVRMAYEYDHYSPTEYENILWSCFTQTQGYDPVTINTYQTHSLGTSPYGPIDRITKGLKIIKSDWSESLIKHPLYAALQSFLEKGSNGYNGLEHFHAAALFDDHHKDPLSAFNALVSGSYWAGRNQHSLLPPVARQAIILCEKEGWEDAAKAIAYQLKKVGWN